MFVQKDIFERIKEVMGFTKEKELSDFLEMSPQSLGTVKKRGTIPYSKIIEKSAGNYNLEYIFFGQLSKTEIPDNAKDIIELLMYANPKFIVDTKEKLLKLKELQDSL